jgi:hypothetical protein
MQKLLGKKEEKASVLPAFCSFNALSNTRGGIQHK